MAAVLDAIEAAPLEKGVAKTAIAESVLRAEPDPQRPGFHVVKDGGWFTVPDDATLVGIGCSRANFPVGKDQGAVRVIKVRVQQSNDEGKTLLPIGSFAAFGTVPGLLYGDPQMHYALLPGKNRLVSVTYIPCIDIRTEIEVVVH